MISGCVGGYIRVSSRSSQSTDTWSWLIFSDKLIIELLYAIPPLVFITKPRPIIFQNMPTYNYKKKGPIMQTLYTHTPHTHTHTHHTHTHTSFSYQDGELVFVSEGIQWSCSSAMADPWLSSEGHWALCLHLEVNIQEIVHSIAQLWWAN